jgi:hypothetical protein
MSFRHWGICRASLGVSLSIVCCLSGMRYEALKSCIICVGLTSLEVQGKQVFL